MTLIRRRQTMTFITLKPINRGLGLLVLSILLIFLMAGCGPSLQEIRARKQLESARRLYGQAKADPNVAAYAPDALSEAGKAMQTAEQARDLAEKNNAQNDYKELEHRAYLSEKKSQIALTITEEKVMEKEIERLNKEKSEVLLQKRDQEIRLAKKEAEQARSTALSEAEKAERAKKEAEEARLLASAESAEKEKANREATMKAQEAKQARIQAEARAREAERAKTEVDELLSQLSDLKAKQTERGIVLTMGDVLFAFDKATLSPEAFRNVDKLADFLRKHPNRSVLIEGHTDSVGSDEYNLNLSEKRADAVKNALVAKGVGEERITPKGYGKKYPVASNNTSDGRQLNRRVEVVVLNEGVKPETQFRE
jgi:outer membrane protein OmpA-like peptidoglycan-associated protein